MDFITFYQSLPLRLDPTFITLFGQKIIQFGSDMSGAGFAVRYYGLMYVFAFLTGISLLKKMAKRHEVDASANDMENLCMWAIVGLLIGARLGFVVFYNWEFFSQNLGQIFIPFANGQFVGIAGMSFHGGVIGGTVFGIIYMIMRKLDIRECLNAVFFAVPLCQGIGRFGNFMNGELYGRITASQIGMFFPSDPDNLRYPSQLFQMFGEGFALFLILLLLRKVWEPSKKIMMPLYFIGYGIIRFFIEFFREPDAHIGLNALGLSRGQMLCAAMIITGIVIIPFFLRKTQTQSAVNPEKTQKKAGRRNSRRQGGA